MFSKGFSSAALLLIQYSTTISQSADTCHPKVRRPLLPSARSQPHCRSDVNTYLMWAISLLGGNYAVRHICWIYISNDDAYVTKQNALTMFFFYVEGQMCLRANTIPPLVLMFFFALKFIICFSQRLGRCIPIACRSCCIPRQYTHDPRIQLNAIGLL